MNLRRVLVGVIAVAALLVGGFLVYQQFLGPESAGDTAVTPGAVDPNTLAVDTGRGAVGAEGVILPLRSATLAFQSSGEVAAILVAQGDAVAAGDPLLRLDTTDQEVALLQAQAALVQARAGLVTAQAGMQAAEVGVKVAAVGVTAAEVQLALVTADARPEEIAIEESRVALAQAGINQAASSQNVVLAGPTTAEVQAAQAELQAAEAQLLPVRNELDRLRREGNASDEALAQAQNRYNAAVANVQAAQEKLNEVQAGATSGERRAAGGGVAATVAQRNAAQAQLDLLLAGARAEQVTLAEAGVAQAKAGQAEAELAIVQVEAGVAEAEAGVAQALAAVDAAQDALDRRVINAPFAGTVANVDANLGEVVNAGVPVVIVADFSAWRVETTDLTELDVVTLAVGFPVEITVDALPGETLPGRVTDIARVSTLTRGDVTYTVAIALEDAAALPLRWGMTVFVNVNVGEGS
jgi:multidrug resistance efflux pump